MKLNAQIFKNKNTGQLILLDKATGRLYAQRMPAVSGLGNDDDFNYLDSLNIASGDSAAASGSGGSWFSNINWDAITNTITEVTSNPLFQDLISNVSFDSGQFQFGAGGGTVTTTPPPPPNQSGFDYKPILYVGGALFATVIIAYALKSRPSA